MKLNICKLSLKQFAVQEAFPTCVLKVIFANIVDPDQTAEQSDQGPHCLPVCKIGLKNLQEYLADDVNRVHFQMQVFLAF